MVSLDAPRKNILVSFAQFRPEKDHELQLRMWTQVLPSLPNDAKFLVIGSCRDDGDKAIVEKLKDYAHKLDIANKVEFKVNLSRSEILSIFKQAKVAVHTMKDEHFGIAVCELMAAGIITIAHASAGPKLDIIGGTEDQVGFLAKNQEEYAAFVQQAMLGFDQMKHIRHNAREHVRTKFSKESFNERFVEMMELCL